MRRQEERTAFIKMSSFNISAVRGQFPALNIHRDCIFLDNPGGTQVPNTVITAISDCLINANANLGGAFETSYRADRLVERAHVAMADFLNAPSPKEVIFGQNMTSLTLHISRSIGQLLTEGDEIIVTTMDHDANIAPWLLMAEDRGLDVKFLPFDSSSYEFDLSLLDHMLTDRTKLICFSHASNMTGTINDAKAVVQKAKSVGALTYIDAVQFAAHAAIDVQDIGCDFLVCSAYKFFGPHIGILWGRESILERLKPYKVRPASEAIPDCFETGTLSHEAMAGVIAAVDYVDWIGRDIADEAYRNCYEGLHGRRKHIVAAFDFLTDYEHLLTHQLILGLQSIPNLRIHGITDPNAFERRVPTVSFSVEGYDPRKIAEQLATENIYVWDGHNYAIEAIKQIGLSDKGGIVRIGIAHYNTKEEIDRTLNILRKIIS